MDETTARCYACGNVRPIADFYRDKSKASGHTNICKPCDLIKSARRYDPIRRKPYRPRDAPRPAPPARSKRTRAIQACAACDTTFPRAKGKRFCCATCRDIARIGEGATSPLVLASCPCCHATFTIRGARKTCGSSLCRYHLTYQRGPTRPCATCATPVPSKQGAPRFCSRDCYEQSPIAVEGRKRAKRRRRARKRGATSERYSAETIYARDHWRCQLCGGKLKRDAVVPHPKAPTIDHIVPLAQGGDDTRANVHAAHFICNARKGDRGSGEQLLLVG